MTSLFHFEDKVHRRSQSRVESTPLLFSRLLCQVLEHLGFPYEPRLECCHDSEASLPVDRWQLIPCSVPLPAEDQPAADILAEKKPPQVEHFWEPQAPTPSVLASPPPAPVPLALLPVFSGPHGPSTAPPDDVGTSISAPPPQHITISTRGFLTIMDAVRTFSTTSASFATAHAAL